MAVLATLTGRVGRKVHQTIKQGEGVLDIYQLHVTLSDASFESLVCVTEDVYGQSEVGNNVTVTFDDA